MKVSLTAAMRARDVSKPTAADEKAAAALAEVQDRTEPPGRARADNAGQSAEQGGDTRNREPKPADT
jgi:hypothetical protein